VLRSQNVVDTRGIEDIVRQDTESILVDDVLESQVQPEVVGSERNLWARGTGTPAATAATAASATASTTSVTTTAARGRRAAVSVCRLNGAAGEFILRCCSDGLALICFGLSHHGAPTVILGRLLRRLGLLFRRFALFRLLAGRCLTLLWIRSSRLIRRLWSLLLFWLGRLILLSGLTGRRFLCRACIRLLALCFIFSHGGGF